MEFIPDAKITQLFRRKRRSGDRWVLKTKLKGSQRTITITYGPCDVVALREARERAKKDLAKIYLGQDPRPQHTKGSWLTLAEAIQQFFNERSIKNSTRTSYQGTLNRNFKRWMNRPIREITGQECIARYQAIRSEVASRKRVNYADTANPPGEAEVSKAIRTLSPQTQPTPMHQQTLSLCKGLMLTNTLSNHCRPPLPLTATKSSLHYNPV